MSMEMFQIQQSFRTSQVLILTFPKPNFLYLSLLKFNKSIGTLFNNVLFIGGKNGRIDTEL